MYVRLKCAKQVSVGGVVKRFNAGDWVEVSRPTALEWVEKGICELPGPDANSKKVVAKILEGDCGVLVLGDRSYARSLLPKGLRIERGKLRLPFEKTFIWSPDVAVTPAQVVLGFSRLEGDWEVAARLEKDRDFISSRGTEEDKRITKELIGDLRIPVYFPKTIFVRRTERTEEFIRLWNLQQGDPNHMLIRALYQAVPLVYTIPSGWGVAHSPRG